MAIARKAGHNVDMRSEPRLVVRVLAALACAVLMGCTATGTSGPAPRALGSSAGPAASSPRPTGPIGSPGNPLLLSCANESFPGYPDPPGSFQPQPGDLVIGPLIIVGGERLATASPAGYGDHGSYKIPIIVRPGSAVTMSIAAPARGRVVISNPYSPVGGVAAASYQSCSQAAGFFAQGFAFTGGQTRGCVPLDVSSSGQSQARHVTLSLFAGSCPP
jgi:hypothetical protein